MIRVLKLTLGRPHVPLNFVRKMYYYRILFDPYYQGRRQEDVLNFTFAIKLQFLQQSVVRYAESNLGARYIEICIFFQSGNQPIFLFFFLGIIRISRLLGSILTQLFVINNLMQKIRSFAITDYCKKMFRTNDINYSSKLLI